MGCISACSNRQGEVVVMLANGHRQPATKFRSRRDKANGQEQRAVPSAKGQLPDYYAWQEEQDLQLASEMARHKSIQLARKKRPTSGRESAQRRRRDLDRKHSRKDREERKVYDVAAQVKFQEEAEAHQRESQRLAQILI